MASSGQQSDAEMDYVRGGKIPWSRGYADAKERFIREVLANPGLIEVFRKKGTLPEKFGLCIDERCVEYPWLIAHLAAGAERLLDAGSTLNYTFMLNHPLLRDKKLHILTLAPVKSCFWLKGGFLSI